jgi:ComEC/Rec2-related protein
MTGHSTEVKTDERQFQYQPESAAQELATPATTGKAAYNRLGANRALIAFRQPLSGFRGFIPATAAAINCEAGRDTQFLFLPVFAGMGAITYFNAGEEPQLSPTLFAISCLAGCRMLARNRASVRLVLLFLMAFATGMLCAKLETMRADTPMLGSQVTTRMTGRISELSRTAKGRWRLTLDVIATERPVLRYGPARVVLSARNLPKDAEIGDGLKALVHLRPQSGPVRPGNYDFAFYNYYRGIGANGFVLGMPEKVTVTPESGILAAGLLAVSTLRQQLTRRILRHITGEEGDIATSLITGYRGGISDETNNAMRLSGLSHVLSISGFHMALVAAIIMGAVRSTFAFFPGVSVRWPVKKLAAAAALCGSAFYLLLSGADVAAQRSFFMLAVMLLAVIADRAAISMRNLAIAACVTIACSPHEILGPSFQMSYSATAALIAFYSFWVRYRRQRGGRNRRKGRRGGWPIASHVPAYLGGLVVPSLVAGTASAIFAVYHFNNTAPLGLAGNALALPVVSVFVMPSAVIALLAMPFDLDWIPFTIMERGIEVVIFIAKTVAAYSPNGNVGSMPAISLVLLTIALLLLLFLSTWLRLFSLPFAAAAFVLMSRMPNPAILVSEDARLVAVRTLDNQLAINRPKGSIFHLNNWQQAYAAGKIIRPAMNGRLADGAQFECMDSLCLAREPGGLIVAYTDDKARMADACKEGDIVILAFSTKLTGCAKVGSVVLSKRDLALYGAAEIRLNNTKKHQVTHNSSLSELELARTALAARLASSGVRYAIGPPKRPWNGYRVYSRAARNIEGRRVNENARAQKTFLHPTHKSALARLHQ